MTTQAAGWLSPSRAWRLLKCPASVGCPARDDEWGRPIDDAETNAGTLAHRTLERWIRTKGYHADDPRATIADAAASCLAELGDAAPPRWTLVRARLLARGATLAELIGSRQPDDIVSETVLTDAATKLHGTPDLVLLGSEMILLDLKTQTFRDGDIPEWATFQLNLYAHLVSTTYGKCPDSVEIFSLNRGRVPVNVTDQSIQSALCELEVARATAKADARPEASVCFFCDRRFACQTHWDVALGWPGSDCIEGAIKRIEVAANGLAAVLVEGKVRETWVSGIPEQEIEDGKIGDLIRLVRLRRAVATAEDKNGGWRWRTFSDLQLARAEAREPGS